MKVIKDKYRHARGDTSKIYLISCVKCGNQLYKYQKDGPGNLRRSYFNRIIEYLNVDSSSLPNALKCKNCNELIGTKMVHSDGRDAFALRYGSWKKEIVKI